MALSRVWNGEERNRKPLTPIPRGFYHVNRTVEIHTPISHLLPSVGYFQKNRRSCSYKIRVRAAGVSRAVLRLRTWRYDDTRNRVAGTGFCGSAIIIYIIHARKRLVTRRSNGRRLRFQISVFLGNPSSPPPPPPRPFLA